MKRLWMGGVSKGGWMDGWIMDNGCTEIRRQDKMTYNCETQDHLGVDVRRRTPVLLKDAPRAHVQLVVEGRGVSGRGRGFGCGDEGSVVLALLQDFQLGLDCLVLVAVAPDLNPVLLCHAARPGTNDREHPLGRVLVLSAGGGPIPFEVVDDHVGILANLAKVHGPTAGSQEKNAVELLVQKCGRLVDGAQDSLAAGRELADERGHGPGGLAVEARGGLVEEEQEVGLGSKLHTNSQAFALFDVET